MNCKRWKDWEYIFTLKYCKLNEMNERWSAIQCNQNEKKIYTLMSVNFS